MTLASSNSIQGYTFYFMATIVTAKSWEAGLHAGKTECYDF